MLREHVAGYLGIPPDRVSAGAVCRRCGGDHGQPVVKVDGAAAPHVSVTRGSGVLATAVSWDGPVGVDAERRGAATPDLGRVLLHPDEVASGPSDLTRTWVRKEAVLKAAGLGLTVDPRELLLTPTGPPWVFDIETAEPYLAAVAVTCASRPALTVERADPEELRRRATS